MTEEEFEKEAMENLNSLTSEQFNKKWEEYKLDEFLNDTSDEYFKMGEGF